VVEGQADCRLLGLTALVEHSVTARAVNAKGPGPWTEGHTVVPGEEGATHLLSNVLCTYTLVGSTSSLLHLLRNTPSI
jgi:hypothetical protein